jgi:acid stress-induced BolA-like protein IbaG/YrbA
MTDQIKTAILAVLPDAEIHIIDPDGAHFQGLVISPAFVGMPLLKQHRMVMNALKEKFDSDAVHALQLKTFTPEKWENQKSDYIR